LIDVDLAVGRKLANHLPGRTRNVSLERHGFDPAKRRRTTRAGGGSGLDFAGSGSIAHVILQIVCWAKLPEVI